MRLYVGVTDGEWFEFLSRVRPDEVNFWRPSGSKGFNVLQPGEPFLFKLHSPNNCIVGGGFFVRYSPLPASLAWEAFGLKNGVQGSEAFLARIRKYRKGEVEVDPVVGCCVLAQPFFFPRPQWVPVPESWAPNIVQGRGYDSDGDGRTLWDSVLDRLAMRQRVSDSQRVAPEDASRFGKEFLARARLGQGAFRVLVTDAYQRRCAMTGEKTLPVLEAAHIKPYAEDGPHRVANGLLLRSDLHKLFDLGYVTVTPELAIEVSLRLRQEWRNGREYYALHGTKLKCVPSEPSHLPDRAYLDWHNTTRFRA